MAAGEGAAPEGQGTPLTPAWLAKSIRTTADSLIGESHDAARPASVDAQAVFEKEVSFFERSQRDVKLQAQKMKNANAQQDMLLRREHAGKAVKLAYFAVGFWASMFLFTGIVNLIAGHAVLSDTGLITLTSGATVNVIAIFLVVVRGLFPAPVSRKPKRRRAPK